MERYVEVKENICICKTSKDEAPNVLVCDEQNYHKYKERIKKLSLASLLLKL